MLQTWGDKSFWEVFELLQHSLIFMYLYRFEKRNIKMEHFTVTQVNWLLKNKNV